ncbi:MAG: energy-coupling factor transporter transmembrane component T [Lachnospiraceae bacterium]
MNTPLIDPRVKLFLFLTICVFVMSVTDLIPNLLIGCFLLFLLMLSGEARSALRMFIPFLLSQFAARYVVESIGGIPAALLLLLCMLLRILIPVFMAFKLVFSTTTMSQFMAAFQKMHVPAVAAIPFAVVFRFIPTAQDEWSGIRQAMAFRGIRVGCIGAVRHPLESIEYILVPLIFSATAIMDERAAASLARGLDSNQKRICAVEVKMKWYDWLFFLISLAFIAYWMITVM